jgi:hypothetical protein
VGFESSVMFVDTTNGTSCCPSGLGAGRYARGSVIVCCYRSPVHGPAKHGRALRVRDPIRVVESPF